MKLLLYRENCMQHVQCNAEIWKQNALGLAEHNLITAATACIRMPAPINLWLRHSCTSIATHETAASEPVACSSFVPRPMADGRSCFLEKSGETFEKAHRLSLPVRKMCHASQVHMHVAGFAGSLHTDLQFTPCLWASISVRNRQHRASTRIL